MPVGRNNSRESAEAAGWDAKCYPRKGTESPDAPWREWLKEREKPKWDSFSWLTVRALFESVNDLFAKFRPEIVDERRARWIAAQRDSAMAASDDFVIEPPAREGARPEDGRAFLLVGDTGEQDASQYAVAPYLTAAATAKGPDGKAFPPEFLLIVSDVIYPAGDINEYVNGFYIPYRRFEKPIYALPGNHDWYDGLDGFMYHFCGAEPLPPERFRGTEIRPATRLANLLWRRSAVPELERLSRWRDKRLWGRDATKAVQPAPYFALDLGDLLLVSIDTGVTGAIDDEQGRWLLRVSNIRKQKILLTGKPIYVDGAYHPGKILWKPSKQEGAKPRFATVDDIVRHRRFGYLAAIGGDVHNYQRYPIWLQKQKRRIYYLVSGGGGAYLSPTHRIGPLGEKPLTKDKWSADELTMPLDEDVPASEEERARRGPVSAPEDIDVATTFHCYPQRGDSLAYTARRAGPRILNLVQSAAAAFVAAAALLRYADPLGESGGLSIAAAYLPIVVVVLAFAQFDLKRRLAGRLGADPPQAWEPDRVRYALAAAGFVVLLVFALAAVAANGIHDGLISEPRFWAIAGVALAVPALLVGAIVWAHDLRGSTPASLPVLAVVAAFTAAIPILHPFGGFLGAPPWFAVIAFVLASMAAGTLVLGGVSSRRPSDKEMRDNKVKDGRAGCEIAFDLLIVAGPALLAYALWQHTAADNVPWLAPALAWCGGWPLLVAWRAKTSEHSRLTGTARFLDEIGAAARYLSVVAWITATAILAHAIGNGWVATAAIGAAATLAILSNLAAMWVLSKATVMKRFLIAFLVGLLLAMLIPLPHAGLLVTAPFVVAAATLLALAYFNVKALRQGKLHANAAQTRVRELLNKGKQPPPGGRHFAPMPPEDEPLFNLLYPYRWDKRERGRNGSKPAQGAERTGSLEQRIAGLLAELGDSDEPPFFKNLLRVDVRERKLSSDDGDAAAARRELTIRCFGVTGFAKEEAKPPVEDEISIPFHSPADFERMHPLDEGPEPVAEGDGGETGKEREAEVEPDEVGVIGVGKAV